MIRYQIQITYILGYIYNSSGGTRARFRSFEGGIIRSRARRGARRLDRTTLIVRNVWVESLFEGTHFLGDIHWATYITHTGRAQSLPRSFEGGTASATRSLRRNAVDGLASYASYIHSGRHTQLVRGALTSDLVRSKEALRA